MNRKNVKTILIDRIENIKKSEDLVSWSENLDSFFEAYHAHPALAPVFAAIRKKKLQAHRSFFQAYQSFADELFHLLQGLQNELQDIDNLISFPWQIVNEIPSSKNLDDPFYQPEAIFFEACKALRKFFENLIEILSTYPDKVSRKVITSLIRYLDISTRIDYKHTVNEEPSGTSIPESFLYRKHFNFEGGVECSTYESRLHLGFRSSPFHVASSQATSLAYNKNAALWKKLDILKKWATWTADGIHPDNLPHKHNLFKFLKMEGAINSFTNHLLDYMVKEEELPEPVKKTAVEPIESPQIRSLSIFPYRASDLDNYAFWIIASHPDGTSTPHYVRKINDGSETHTFIETLLSLQSGDIIPLEDASSSRAELSLTKEVGKVFFGKLGQKRIVFRGFCLFLNDVDENLNFPKLHQQLRTLNKQQDIPKFPQEEYQAFLLEHGSRSQIPTYSDV